MSHYTFKPLAFTAILCFLMTIAASAQSFDNIVNGFKNGDASAIAKNFEGNVEITIKTGSTSYSKSQAEMVLKSFFAAHKPKTFAVAHEGTSPQGSKYFIGNLTTAAGNYRTYVYAKTVKTELVIQEIRFEEQ
jgi:hypothetical protein